MRKRLWHALIISALLAVLLPASLAGIGQPVLAAAVPAVTTEAATSVGTDSATLNGTITDTGGENCDIRGFDYGLTTDYGSEVTESGSFETGSFSQVLSGLSPETTYYYRAKAHNSAGWSYGADMEFTTGRGGSLDNCCSHCYYWHCRQGGNG